MRQRTCERQSSQQARFGASTAKAVSEGANRGASLTQRLLAFARRQELKLAPADPTLLVRGLGELITKSVGPDIELRYELGEKMPPVLVDPNQVELAILNLVVNARDAMPDGGLITIATEMTDVAGDERLADGAYVRISVIDNGTGMDAATVAKATEPFFSTKELGKGTGLGLSMVHGLAIQLHGTLRLHSQVDKGTRAELLLPTTGQMQAKVASASDVETRVPPTARTILVVDDDALIAMSTAGLLEDLGHTVREVNSGAEALRLIESGEQFDLVVTDYSMPKMNGGQLAIALRQIRPDLPILLASGYADLPPGTELDLPRLPKPYNRAQLQQEIAKLLSS